jgi:hypothetical protein
VTDSKGPVAGAMIELMPDESDVYSGTVTDSSGKYSMTGLRPGKYRLLAVDEKTDALLTDRGAMEDYEDRFAKVELHAGDKVTKDLKQSLPGQ